MFLNDVAVLHHIIARSIDRQEHPLSAYAGKVVLVVNTASECGYTPQYEGLEALYRAYKDRGFVVLGFPSNDFGGQEPGGEEAIKEFCNRGYGVTFPLFEKVKTKGPDASAVYAFLAAKHGPPRWNFHKYLVGRDGAVRAAFESGVAPDDPKLRAAIEEALAS
jgi:glutathione peroxidase